MGSSGVRAPVWTASGMRYWKRLIKIPSGTECYYCINNMTCLIHVYYCSVVLITVSDILSTVMSPIYLVTLSDTYTSYGDTLCMYTYTLHSIYSVPCILCRHCCYIITTLLLYNYNTVVWLFCILHIYMFIFSTIPYATVIIRLNKKYKVIKTVTCYLYTWCN